MKEKIKKWIIPPGLINEVDEFQNLYAVAKPQSPIVPCDGVKPASGGDHPLGGVALHDQMEEHTPPAAREV